MELYKQKALRYIHGNGVSDNAQDLEYKCPTIGGRDDLPCLVGGKTKKVQYSRSNDAGSAEWGEGGAN